MLPFLLECDAPACFHQGQAQSLRFRFRAFKDVFEGVELELREDGRTLRKATVPRRPGTESLSLPVTVCPKDAGRKLIEVVVTCRRDGTEEGDLEVYSAELEIEIEPEDSKQVTFVTNVGNVSGAGDVRINNSVIDDPYNLSGKRRPPEDFRPTAMHAVEGLNLVKTASRLTLTVGSAEIQLFGGESIVLGRSRDCDLVTRSFDANGSRNEDASRRISGRHCTLTLSDAGLRVSDGFAGKPSTCGTLIDGRRLDQGGMASLRSGKHRLGLAEISSGEVALELELELVLDEMGRSNGLVLRRFDGAKQLAVLARRREVSFAEGAVTWDGGMFRVKCTDGEWRSVIPGDMLCVFQSECNICPRHSKWI